MSTVRVDPGVCGFIALVKAESEDGQTCTVTIQSACDAVAALGADLASVDGFEVAFKAYPDNPVYKAALQHFRHAACPVPGAIVKAVELACGLALPKDVSFLISKD